MNAGWKTGGIGSGNDWRSHDRARETRVHGVSGTLIGNRCKLAAVETGLAGEQQQVNGTATGNCETMQFTLKTIRCKCNRQHPMYRQGRRVLAVTCGCGVVFPHGVDVVEDMVIRDWRDVHRLMQRR